MKDFWSSYLSVYTGNKWVDYNINALILSLIILIIPLFVALMLPLFKKKKNNKKSKSLILLYSFTTGFFTILGLFDEANEGREIAINAAKDNFVNLVLYQIIVLGGGAIIGFGLAIGMKILLNRKLGKFNPNSPVEIHSEHIAFHNHPHVLPDLIFKKYNDKNKVVALYLILSHRLAAGFFLGYTIFQMVAHNYNDAILNDDNISLVFLIGFFLHLIPEEVIIYYRQKQMGIKNKRAVINSILMLFLLIPFIFLGANIGTYIKDIWWLTGIIHVIVGVLFTFVALIEFLPEIIREVNNQKDWYLVILFISIGILVCFLLITFTH